RWIKKLDGAADVLVELLAALQQNGVVSNLLGQRVLEDVFHIRDRRLLVHEFAKLQIADQPLEFVLRSPGDGPREAEDELAAQHRQRLEEILFVVAQPIDAGGEDRLHGRGYAERGKRPHQLDCSVRPLKRAFIEQRLHRLLHEERRAAGGLDDQLLKRKESGRFAEDR